MHCPSLRTRARSQRSPRQEYSPSSGRKWLSPRVNYMTWQMCPGRNRKACVGVDLEGDGPEHEAGDCVGENELQEQCSHDSGFIVLNECLGAGLIGCRSGSRELGHHDSSQ